MRYITTNVRFDPRDYEDLQRLAAASGHSLAAHVRFAVSAYLGHPERPDGGEAAEDTAVYTGTTPRETELSATVQGNTLVLDHPLPDFPDGTRLWVRCLAEAEVQQRAQRRTMLARLLEEFEAMPPGKPAPLNDDDRELYDS